MKTQSITSFFEADHERLDKLFKDYQLLKHSNLTKARAIFSDFAAGLLRHIQWEEEILFPIFEAKSGLEQGPTSVMRFEHEQIKKALHQISDSFNSEQPRDESAEGILTEVLVQHNIKEENILYPMLDQMLNSEELVTIFNKINKTVGENHECCCGIHI